MTPSPTPSEGEAMLALADRAEKIARDGLHPVMTYAECTLIAKALRAAAQSSGVIRGTVKTNCAYVPLSPDTPREGER